MRTAESVSPKHPDKLCDFISDSLLDAILEQDKDAKVAIESMGGHGEIKVTGEVTANAVINYEEIIRNIVGDDYIIQKNIVEQSREINQGVITGGAGDQGIMVGYACNENEEMIPQELYLARNLCKYVYEINSNDGKTQITLNDNNEIEALVCSFCGIKKIELQEIVNNWLIDKKISKNIKIHINPSGEWTIGGFDADAGVTGRKLIVDNYGPQVNIGGGAFCFSGDTIVKIENGYKMISDIKPNDKVWTLNEGNNNTELKKVNKVFEKSKEDSYDLLEIELENGEIIKITENHEIKTNRGWIKAKDLELNDEIIDWEILSRS